MTVIESATDEELTLEMRRYQGLAESAPPETRPVYTEPQPEPLPASSVVGAAELIAAGFEPLESFTGDIWITDDWPEGHKRSLPESRPDWLPECEGEQVWFVTSPWPSLTPQQVLNLVWAHLTEENEPRWPEVRREIFGWSDERAVAAFVALDLQD